MSHWKWWRVPKPGIWEGEAGGGFQVQSHPWRHEDLEASLDYLTPVLFVLQTKTKNKNLSVGIYSYSWPEPHECSGEAQTVVPWLRAKQMSTQGPVGSRPQFMKTFQRSEPCSVKRPRDTGAYILALSSGLP